MPRVLGFWKCSSCGTKDISGLKRECPNCGLPRGEDVKFYMTADSRDLTEQEEKQIAKEPDWLCSFCGCYNSNNLKVCKFCGAPHDNSAKSYKEVNQSKMAKMSPYLEKSDAHTNSEKSSSDLQHNNNKATFYPISMKFMLPLLGSLGAAIGVICLILLFITIFTPKLDSLNVQTVTWNYNVKVEQLKTFKEDGWSIPTGARVYKQNQEFYKYNKVIDHYETKTKQVGEREIVGYDTKTEYADNGNGTFDKKTKQVPRYETVYHTETYEEPVYRKDSVYKTKYYYEIDRWVFYKDYPTTGNDKSPYYAEVDVSSSKLRIGDKSEKYSITAINTKNETDVYAVSHSDWETLEPGQRLKVKVYFDNSIEIIKDID